MMKKCILSVPPPDMELGIPRDPLEYFVIEPDQGVRSTTGVILWIPGWGMSPQDVYSSEKLMPYLANHHNCVVVGVRYHGMRVKVPGADATLSVDGEWLLNVHRAYNIPQVSDINQAFQHLAAAGVKAVDQRFPLLLETGADYLSFGFLPALDHIAVLGELLKSYAVDRRRMFALGTSYGGYIASLLLKLMPNTLTMVIDNSGFAKTKKDELNYREAGLVHNGYASPNGVGFSVIPKPVWSLKDPASKTYFRPAFDTVRDLTVAEHWGDSKTLLYCFHSQQDKIAPYADKCAFCAVRSAMAPTQLITVSSDDIDGHLFKNLVHGLGASMRALFNHGVELAGPSLRDDTQTDFDRQTRVALDCADMTYRIDYSQDFSFQAALSSRHSKTH